MDNFLTDVDRTLKQGLEAISLDGNPVPLRIVTPDPDFAELTLPCLTLQLTDLRQDFARTDNGREVKKDMGAMEAKVRGGSRPYNLHYTVTAHTEKSRDDRLLLGEVVYFLDEHLVMRSVVFGRELYLHRDISFRDFSRARGFAKSLGLVVKLRLDAREESVVPIVRERIFKARERRT
jgi:hypothetical protein